MQSTKKLSPVIIALIATVLVGIVTTAIVVANQPKDTPTAEILTDTSKSYKDGTYTETGRYISPGGAESIKVTVTLAQDIITDASVTGDANDRDAKMHQDDFIAGFKSFVVGKDIDTVSLSRVAGASLTSNGFNAALKLIKTDAQE